MEKMTVKQYLQQTPNNPLIREMKDAYTPVCADWFQNAMIKHIKKHYGNLYIRESITNNATDNTEVMEDIQDICDDLYLCKQYNYERLNNLIQKELENNPLENYNIHESITDITTIGSQSSNSTTTQGSQTTTQTQGAQDSTVVNNVDSWDGTSAENDTSTSNLGQREDTNVVGERSDTSLSNIGAREDGYEHTMDKSGNIGVTSVFDLANQGAKFYDSYIGLIKKVSQDVISDIACLIYGEEDY